MHGLSRPRTSPQRAFPFDSTRPEPFTSSSAPASAVRQASDVRQPTPNDPMRMHDPDDPVSANLFSKPSQPHDSDEQRQPDPFDDDIDLSDELGVFERLDAIKFLL